MEDENEQIGVRKQKLEKIRSQGKNPYPYKFEVSHHTSEIKDKYGFIGQDSSSEEQVSLAGRVRAIRKMGKIHFIDIEDIEGRIQFYIAKNNLGEEKYEELSNLDLGDFIGVKGNVFRTKSGELTVLAKEYDMLCKATRSLPSEHYGLKDPELRYRHRSIDLIMNPDVKDVFIKRTKAITAMREFLDSNKFFEVETPLLQSVYGGASARPFITKINTLNIPLYLSISPELYLKRLIVGGMERVYTICKNFRNEGIDTTHNPEFTMMECYQSYADYNDMMELTENMYAHIFNKVNGKTKVKYLDTELDFTPPWKRITMYDMVKQYTGIDVERLNKDQIGEQIREKGYEGIHIAPEDTKGSLVQELFEIYCEDKLVQPTFVIDHPKESTPLCKLHRNNPDLIERFEPFVYSMEIGNAYSELNDPILQRKLLEEQDRIRLAGDDTANPVDEEFLKAIEWGMPPTGGLGLGIDRMVMLLTNSRSIRDVIYFPFMKPTE